MRSKTKKLIWLAPVTAVMAVVAALAIFAAQPADPAAAHGAPGAVTGLTATKDGQTMIKLQWNKPSTGDAPTGYRIDVSEDAYVWMALVADTESTDTKYTATGLKPSSLRYYRVFALNSAGVGPVHDDVNYAYDTTRRCDGSRGRC